MERAISTQSTQGSSPEQAAELARVAAYFDAAVQRYGYDHRALDYGSWAAQHLRFEVLADGLPLQGARLLDVGCGFGDFKTFLKSTGAVVDYRGLDISQQAIALARARHPDGEFAVGDLLTGNEPVACDVAVANGIFYRTGARAEEMLRATLVRMFELAERAVAITTLSAWAPQQAPDEFHADPPALLAFARTLTPWVRLRHDYLPHDFALFLYHEPPVA
jgi:SAM-dependent methyltransferase